MSGPLHFLIAAEHRHLEQALREPTADPERIDSFRSGLLPVGCRALIASVD